MRTHLIRGLYSLIRIANYEQLRGESHAGLNIISHRETDSTVIR